MTKMLPLPSQAVRAGCYRDFQGPIRFRQQPVRERSAGREKTRSPKPPDTPGPIYATSGPLQSRFA